MVDALYVHVPFCAARCRYCDFSTAATRRDDPLMAAYAGAVECLLDEARGLGLIEVPRTAYIGGGTPTLLGPAVLGSLVGAITGAGAVPELSFEANPESLSDAVLDAALKAGATRVSVGVQSLDDRELAALGRIHGAKQARARVSAAVAAGLDVSLDLMCGIPYQTPASWRRSLEGALELGIGHISCYPLMIEEGTPLERLCERGELPWPDDDTEAASMDAAARLLAGRGFARYEVASYARPGRECRHNMAYWTGVEYLGLGTAASSMLGRGSYAALREAVPALPEPREDAARFRLTVASSAREVADARGLAHIAFEVEQLTAREAAAEDLMLAMRMTAGADAALIERASASIPRPALDAALSHAVERGLAAWTPDGARLAPTGRGWLIGNELYGLMWDLASDT